MFCHVNKEKLLKFKLGEKVIGHIHWMINGMTDEIKQQMLDAGKSPFFNNRYDQMHHHIAIRRIPMREGEDRGMEFYTPETHHPSFTMIQYL